MIRSESTIPAGPKRQENINDLKQFILKDLLQTWRLIDKNLPAQLGAISDGLKRPYNRSDLHAGLPTNLIMFLCMAGVLYRDGIMTMGQLRRATSIPQATITRMVRWMVDNGLVVRYLDAKDKRIAKVRLTDSGLELLLSVKNQLKEFAAVLLEDIPTVQRMAFILCLSDIINAWHTV